MLLDLSLSLLLDLLRVLSRTVSLTSFSMPVKVFFRFKPGTVGDSGLAMVSLLLNRDVKELLRDNDGEGLLFSLRTCLVGLGLALGGVAVGGLL